MQEAAGELRNKGLLVIRLEETSIAAQIWASLNREIQLRPAVSSRDLASLSQEWAGLLEAGISVEEALSIVMVSRRPSAAKVLSGVRDEVIKGSSLHVALARFPDCFPTTYVTLIQAGEAAGALGSTLKRLADDLSMQRGVMEDVRNALLYPGFLLVTAIVGISTLLVAIVPNLEDLLGEQGLDTLPVTTRLIITASHALREHGLSALGVVGVLALSLTVIARTEIGRLSLHRLLLQMPLIGALIQAVETGRFARSFSALLKGGVSVPIAMPLAVKTISSLAIRLKLERAYDGILTGTSIGDAIAKVAILPRDAIGLIRMGERTGQLDLALERTAMLYEGRATRRLKALTTLMTPSLTIAFGLVAGGIIYAMLSAILSINDLAVAQ
ncbi:type II secretion system F family protein [Microvirga sp. G4-2]|uniref:type II secretion system F family protein n=1 Tax=Microvirga sp. G4-2 TaxID=3434467 RepID=UPI004044600E